MPDQGTVSPALGELARQVRDVLGRFENLADKLDVRFVNKDNFKLYSDSVSRELEHLVKAIDQQAMVEKERNEQLERRIAKMENNITWVVRVVVAAIIVALLAGIGITKAGGGG